MKKTVVIFIIVITTRSILTVIDRTINLFNIYVYQIGIFLFIVLSFLQIAGGLIRQEVNFTTRVKVRKHINYFT